MYSDFQVKTINNVSIAFATSDLATEIVQEIVDGKVKKSKVKDALKSTIAGLLTAGDDNQFPEKLKKVVNSSYRLKQNMHLGQRELMSLGLQPGIIFESEQGEEEFRFKKNTDWRDFNRRWDLDIHYLTLSAHNLKTYLYTPVEIILNESLDQIVMVETKEAWTFRFAEPDNNGIIQHCYLCANWELNPRLDDTEKVRKLPLLFNTYAPADTLLYRAIDENESNFIMLLRVETDELIYPIPYYFPVITQGIIDISIDATKYKKYILKNIVGASVIAYIPTWYWQKKYPDWDKLGEKFMKGDKTAEKQLQQYRQEIVDKVTELLSGAENAGRIILADVNEKLGKLDPLLAKSITIEVIDKAKFTGEFIPDQQEADSQIDWATDIDASRYGSKPGATNNSGNAKSNAQNIGQVSQYAEEVLLLQIPQLIRDFNQYDTEMEFRIRRTTLVSMDAVSPADRPTTPQ